MTQQPEPILDPDYWSRRLRHAPPGCLHHAIFRCSTEQWLRIEARHRQILSTHIQPEDSILDAGCGWGRLLDLLPSTWYGAYLGVDLSPDFLHLAKQLHPDRRFLMADLTTLGSVVGPGHPFDWCVLVSIRPMIRRNLGGEVWNQVEEQLHQMARKILYLECDENDPGSVE